MVEEEVVDGEAGLWVILVVSVCNNVAVVFEVFRVVDKGDSRFGHDEIIILEYVVDEAYYLD